MKLVILDAYAMNPGDISWKPLEEFASVTVYDRTAPEQVIRRIGDAELVLLNKTPIPAEVFDACPSLKYIGVLATGYNIVDIAAAAAHGVCVCNVPGYSTAAVVQMTFALLLELTQQVGSHSRAVFSGQWQNCPDFCFWNHPLTELAGKTLGIVGHGAIGQAVGRVAKAFGMRTLVTARHAQAVPEFTDLDTLLKNSDIVSLHCPQTAENQGMIGAEALEKMKPGALLINTARGGLIDEAAVAEALKDGKLAGFAADVVSKEPIAADNPLLTAPNCVLTPHIAWAPLETRARLLEITVENLRAFLSGKPIHRVN